MNWVSSHKFCIFFIADPGSRRDFLCIELCTVSGIRVMDINTGNIVFASSKAAGVQKKRAKIKWTNEYVHKWIYAYYFILFAVRKIIVNLITCNTFLPVHIFLKLLYSVEWKGHKIKKPLRKLKGFK